MNAIIDRIDVALMMLPPFTQENALFYVLNGIIFFIVFQALQMIVTLLLNKQLALTSRLYTSSDSRDRKILIIGDSTAVGTGASSPEETLAGRLAHDFPHTQVINLGKNGGLISDLKDQIDQVRDQKFDMIIISAGGNDVWHFTRLKKIRDMLDTVLADAVRMSDGRVIFLVYNNIGDAPIFPKPVRFILKQRCIRIQDTIRFYAALHKIPTIDLFTHEEDNPFLKNPEVLFASDGIHPSSRGYALWYHRMWRQMVQIGFYYE